MKGSLLYILISVSIISISGLDTEMTNNFKRKPGNDGQSNVIEPPGQSKSFNVLPTNERGNSIKLSEDPKCKDDIIRLCGEGEHHNFATLECVQRKNRDDSALLSEACHNLLWSYKLNLTRNSRIEEFAIGMCKKDLDNLTECASANRLAGHTISCMIQHLDQLTDEGCRHHLVRLAVIIFSDYNLVGHMAADCENDVRKLGCGRVQNDGSKQPHSQGITIECLSNHADTLESQCHNQIMRLAELQSEDFQLDRALFFACRDDRYNFCKNIETGSGRVYKCLMNHKKSRNMSPECARQLSRRQALVAQDYKVSHGLARSCRSAIMENRCRKMAGDDAHDVKLSKILLCLESALRKGKKIDGECQEEMLSHRQMVLQDFSMSPDLLVGCGTDVNNFCQGVAGPRILHCLMKHAKKRGRKKVTDHCQRMLEDAVKESDPGEDWRADPILYETCLPVVQSRCKNIRGGEGRVMRCLMRQLGSPFMTTDCEETLLEIQYFIARDWKLDPQLYHACHSDAVQFCHAQKEWINTPEDNSDNSILVLPCLFRNAYHPNIRLDPKCTAEVHRVMHERAAYVELHPKVELDCMRELATFCSENTGPGEEIACLQHNLEKLEKPCMDQVKNYTVAQAKDFRLNNLLMTHCSEILEQVCNYALQNAQYDEADGSIMDCLIDNKNSPIMRSNYKCRAVVEDFQVVMIEDISFTPHFKKDCQLDVKKHCVPATNRKEVLECLSKKILKDTLNDIRPSVSKKCKQQVRKQITQRHENIRLDPDLKKACSKDIEKNCGEETGGGAVLECLRNRPDLLPACHKIVFQREKEESADPLTDVVLMRKCKAMIKTFCRDEDANQILPCLMREKENPDFEQKCKGVVIQRMIERSKDVELNPQLYHACKQEMSTYCAEAMIEGDDVERNGKVIECLKEHLPKKSGGKLSSKCTQKIIQITKNAALNYKLDPILNEKCGSDLENLCHSQETESDEKGEVEECLKKKFKEDKIVNEECKVYIAQLTQVEGVDIHADPVLYRACLQDDKSLCKEEAVGSHLSCLYEVLDRKASKLSLKCQNKLKERREMFKVAQKVFELETIEDLVDTVKVSPQRNYFMIVFISVVGSIFLGGLVCGRASKRTYKQLKNR